MRPSYILQVDEKTFCKYYGKSVELLCHAMAGRGSYMFYICFDCRKVFQVGKGEVPRE